MQAFEKVKSFNTENYFIIEHLVKLCLYPINVFIFIQKNSLFSCDIYFIDSAIFKY